MTAMTSKKTAAEALRQAAQQHRAAVDAAARVSKALEIARQGVPEPAGPSLEELLREARALEAAAALGEIEPADAEKRRKTLAIAKRAAEQRAEQRQQADDVIAGLEDRQRAAAAAVVAGLDAMERAEKDYRQAIFEEADAAYLKAALELGAAYRRARAAIGIDRLLSSREPVAYPLGGVATKCTTWGRNPTISLIDDDAQAERDAILKEIGAITSASPVRPGFIERAKRIALGERVEVA